MKKITLQSMLFKNNGFSRNGLANSLLQSTNKGHPNNGAISTITGCKTLGKPSISFHSIRPLSTYKTFYY